MLLSAIISSQSGVGLCPRLSSSGPYFGHMCPGGMAVLTRILSQLQHISGCRMAARAKASLPSICGQMSMSCSWQYKQDGRFPSLKACGHHKEEGAGRTTQVKWHQESGVFLYCFDSADLLGAEPYAAPTSTPTNVMQTWGKDNG